MICKICERDCIDVEFLRRHVAQAHKTTTQEYVLCYELNSVIPQCHCGCGQNVTWHQPSKQFNKYVHGHHAQFRKKSEEEKRKIGDKNSINMKRFYAENPDIAKEKNRQLRSGITSEIEVKRIDATKQAYEDMSPEDKQRFSEHSKHLWNDQRELMDEAHRKSAETFKERAANGEYDFESRNDKISQTVTDLYLKGGFCWSRGTFLKKDGSHVPFRSNWEFQRFCQLDDDSGVSEWKSEFARLPYELEETTKRYIPDLLIRYTNGDCVFEEIKPLELRDHPKNVAKRKAALDYCNQHGLTYREWPL